MRGDARLEFGRLHRREDAEFVGLGEARCVDRDEDVGGAVCTFGTDALEEFVFLGLDAVDLDPGLPCEVGAE